MIPPNPGPLLLLPIRPATDVDRERLDRGLQQLTAEDPTLGILANPATGLVVVGAVSELQLEIVIDRLRREFGVDASVEKPEVVHAVLGRALDEDLDGEKVEAVVLEPVMRIEVTVPTEHRTMVLLRLAMRWASIQESNVRDETLVIRAIVKLSQMFGFRAELHSCTGGRGTYSMSFHSYQPVRADEPPNDDDRTSHVPSPLRPAPGSKSSSVALPEPDDGLAEI